MKYFKTVMIFFYEYETYTEENRILEFFETIANAIVIS